MNRPSTGVIPLVIDTATVKASIGTNDLWGVMHIPAFGDDYEVGIAEGTDLFDRYR